MIRSSDLAYHDKSCPHYRTWGNMATLKIPSERREAFRWDLICHDIRRKTAGRKFPETERSSLPKTFGAPVITSNWRTSKITQKERRRTIRQMVIRSGENIRDPPRISEGIDESSAHKESQKVLQHLWSPPFQIQGKRFRVDKYVKVLHVIYMALNHCIVFS